MASLKGGRGRPAALGQPLEQPSGVRAKTACMQTLSFPDMVALIEDRSAALREAAAQAGMGARVPGCPDWTVTDLVTHLGQV
jgi:Mycothiol maleylpyruvate isomerase N-terminal domain